MNAKTRTALNHLVSEAETLVFYAQHLRDAVADEGASAPMLEDVNESARLLQAAVQQVNNAKLFVTKRGTDA